MSLTSSLSKIFDQENVDLAIKKYNHLLKKEKISGIEKEKLDLLFCKNLDDNKFNRKSGKGRWGNFIKSCIKEFRDVKEEVKEKKIGKVKKESVEDIIPVDEKVKKKKTKESVKDDYSKRTDTFSITFGDCAENHVGMQKIGKLAKSGFTCQELKRISKSHPGVEYHNLKDLIADEDSEDETEEASIIIIRNGLDVMEPGNAAKLFTEMKSQKLDKMAKMRGKVVNKHARWNNCFADISQEPDYEKGKGTIIDFKDVPILSSIRDNLPSIFGEKSKGLMAETNYYYDVKKCGIGFHGDAERRIVICARLGASMPLDFQWFQNSKPVGKRFSVILNHGDVYAMSEKATGFDWKKRIKATLRHSAGCDKYRKTKT